VLHFDGKAIVEEYIISQGIPATFLHLGIFMNYTLFNLVPTIAGSKSYSLSFPMPGSTKIPLISANKDTGNYVKSFLLNREKFLGRRISAGENWYTLDEIASILKNVGGLNILKHEQCSEEDYKKRLAALGAPDFFVDDMAENAKFIHEFGFYGGLNLDNDVCPAFVCDFS